MDSISSLQTDSQASLATSPTPELASDALKPASATENNQNENNAGDQLLSNNKIKKNAQIGYKDDLGRYYAIGKRKTAVAAAYLTPILELASKNEPQAESTDKASETPLDLEGPDVSYQELPTVAMIDNNPDIQSALEGAENVSSQESTTEAMIDNNPDIQSALEGAENVSSQESTTEAMTDDNPDIQSALESAKSFEKVEKSIQTPGLIYVNGKPLSKYFTLQYDRESVIFPLSIVSEIGHYNIWLTVRGGGLTGQAEALSLALARALSIANPSSYSRLSAAGCLTADPRQVERKKTGQPKARKKFAWVKR
ncbi:hypothetical protein BB561_002119 [Smittium simulii]|uniref:30S ribosomal protein S9 n=1 Tax=Smittium simulii TaxID=133385 RepID=A0A2T9YRQ8_9FUNG|nr:hypothetical protein BB561_002119 [Smittium simulii]